jgi:fumarate reductase flavoprotein subunit
VYWHPSGIIIPAGRSEALLEKHINEHGFEINYETRAIYLLQDGHHVTGLIAKGPKGYIKYKTNKAVILCTGGYEGNKEMIKKYVPEAHAILQVDGKATNTGDGYLMEQWIGARMDPWPHSTMTWDGMNPEALEQFRMDYCGVSRQAWLYVNAFGERFMDEDATFAGVAKSLYMQPHAMMWSVFDERWRDQDILEKLAGSVCRRMTTRRTNFILPMNLTEMTEKFIKAGIILKADTIEELAAKMNQAGPKLGIGADLDVNTFKSTVERYNQLAKSGHDSDFGKDPQMFFPCDKPPYYAIRTGYGILVVQAGALINENFQPIDKEGKVFQGLYACGNVAGGFNAYEYSMTVDKGSLGRATTMGYLAAKYAAGQKV